MTLEQTVAFAVPAGTLVLFVSARWRYDLVALLALLALTGASLPQFPCS